MSDTETRKWAVEQAQRSLLLNTHTAEDVVKFAEIIESYVISQT